MNETVHETHLPMPPIDPFAYYTRLHRLKTFIEERYSEPISVARAARVVGLAEKYFSTFFRERVGIPFKAWLRRFRVTKAKEMMCSRNVYITEVAFEVGFEDISTFIRAFKSCEQMTPSEYKRRFRPPHLN